MIWLNENNAYAAQWLRNLIEQGYLPHGRVDDRSILAVRPADLDHGQCHFFAGIGGWPYALDLAGWPRGREVWTASLPCQPLSVAGQRKGALDERHLWPAFHALVAVRRPAVIFGEQVASQDGREWLAAVRADLEGDGYAVGAACLPAAGVGAPHRRYRLFWVAHRLGDAHGLDQSQIDPRPDALDRQRAADGRRTVESARAGADGRTGGRDHSSRRGSVGPAGALADASHEGREGRLPWGQNPRRGIVDGHLGRGGAADGLADADRGERGWRADAEGLRPDGPAGERDQGDGVAAGHCETIGLADAAGGRRQQCDEGDGRLSEPDPHRSDERLGDAQVDGWREQHRLAGSSGEGGGAQELVERSAGSGFWNDRQLAQDGRAGLVAHADGERGGPRACGGLERQPDVHNEHRPRQGKDAGRDGGEGGGREADRPRPSDGFWRDPDWLFCRDGKWRPTQPGLFPLAHGVPNRVGILRAAGNAIIPQVAAEFIAAYLEEYPT